MALNRYNELLNSQKYVDTYIPLPIDAILKVGAMKQQVQDQGAAERAQFLNKSWNRLPADVQRSVEIQNELNSKLESFANKDFNDPNVKADWYRTKLDIAKQFSPNGEVGAQEANYNLFYKEKDKLDKMLEKGSKDGGIDKGTYDYLLNKAVNEFSTSGGTGKLGPAGFNIVKFDTPATYQDIYKQAQDATAHWKADAISKGGYSDDSGQFIKKSTQEIEAIDPNEIIKYVTPALMADPMNQAFARQQVAINSYGRNIDPNLQQQAYMDIFRKPVEAVANEMGYTKKKYDEQWQNNPVEQYKAKRAFDDQEVKKGMRATTLQGIPANNLSETNTDSGINNAVRNSGNPISKYWEFKNGVPQMVNPADKKVYTINGKQYTYEDLAEQGKNLPSGYKVASVPTATGVDLVVRGPKGEEIKATVVDEKDFQLNAYKELLNTANRLGITGTREEVEKGVGDYYRTAYNLQLNVPKFNPGIQKALTDMYGVKTKTDSDGKLSILDPGQLSFSTLKDINGKALNGDKLKEKKVELLAGGKIIAAAQSLTNDNYEPGDMLFQTKNNDIILINTNDKDWNSRFKQSTDLIKSVNNFVNTGQRSILPEHRADIEKYGLTTAISSTRDNQGNDYIVYLYKGKPEVAFFGADGSNDVLSLDEVSKRLVNSNLVDLLPTINPKNLDRATKTDQFDTEE